MKMTQRDKLMLMLLCVVLIVAMGYKFVLSPLMADQKVLAEQLITDALAWSDKSTPILSAFDYATDAENLWKTMDPAVLENKLDRLIEDNENYKLGKQISDLQLSAALLDDPSQIIPSQPEWSLFGFIKFEYLDEYINFNDFDISQKTDVDYEIPGTAVEGLEPVTYNITTSRITIASFNCNDNLIDNLYQMLNVIENSGYIVIEKIDFDPSGLSGSMTLLILMTPGELSEYSTT